MASKRLDPNASLADYKEHVARKQPMGNTKPKEHSARKTPLGNTKPKEHLAQKRTKIDKAIANAQAFQKQRTALMNMSTKDKLGAALESSIIGAATGGGIIAAQKGIRAAVNSGIPARIGNKVTGQKVLVHGTPDFEKLIGNKLMPKAGSPGSPTEKVVFGYNPQFKGSGSADYLEGSVKQYTGPKGGAIIAKFPKKSLKNLEYQESNAGLVNQMAAKGNPLDPKNPPWVLSKSPARIVAKVPVAGGDFKNQLARELKLAGAPLRDSTREKAIERLLRERASKKYNKNNPSVV